MSVKLDNICFSCGQLPLLSNINFNFYYDCVYLVVGTPEENKEALFDIIAGLEKNYLGNCYLDDKNRSKLLNSDIKISYYKNNNLLFGFKSAVKNVEYVDKINGKKVNSINKQKIKNILNYLGLNNLWLPSFIRKKYDKEAICFARMMYKNGDIILINSVKNINVLQKFLEARRDGLFNLNKHSCVIISASMGQNLALFNNCQKLILQYGVNLCEFNPNLLLKNPGDIYAYFIAKNYNKQVCLNNKKVERISALKFAFKYFNNIIVNDNFFVVDGFKFDNITGLAL